MSTCFPFASVTSSIRQARVLRMISRGGYHLKGSETMSTSCPASINARLRFATCSSAPPETNGTCVVQIRMFIFVGWPEWSIANRNNRRTRFQTIAVIIAILRLCDPGDAEAQDLEHFTIRADRVAPPRIVVIGIVSRRFEPRDPLFSLQHRRHDYHRLFRDPRNRSQRRDLIIQMLQYRGDNHHVELSQLFWQSIDVSIKNICLGSQQAVTQPVGILPPVDLDCMIRHKAFIIAVVQLVLERDESLLSRVAHVKGDDSRSSAFF